CQNQAMASNRQDRSGRREPRNAVRSLRCMSSRWSCAYVPQQILVNTERPTMPPQQNGHVAQLHGMNTLGSSHHATTTTSTAPIHFFTSLSLPTTPVQSH